MARKTGPMIAAEAVADVLANSDAYAAYGKAQARQVELQRERAAVIAERSTLEAAAPSGVTITTRDGRRWVREPGSSHEMPLADWSRQRADREKAEAEYEGRAAVVVADSTSLVVELANRETELDAAILVAVERVAQARQAAQRDVRAGMQKAYRGIVAGPLADVLEPLGEIADRAEFFTDELVAAGLSPNVITGLLLAPFSGRRKDSQLRLLLAQAREMIGS